jgi:signal transduction histidine kinase
MWAAPHDIPPCNVDPLEQSSMTDTVRQPNVGQTGRDSAVMRVGNGKSVDANGELLNITLARVARLEAVLAITGGSVHDVNNLLTILTGELYLLTESVRQDVAMFEKVRSTRNIVESASTLMRELLTYARYPVDEPPSICPASHVLALEPLLRRSLPIGQRLSVCHREDSLSVAASAAQFESAVTNLVLIDRDAVGTGGTMEVRVDDHVGHDRAAGAPWTVQDHTRRIKADGTHP